MGAIEDFRNILDSAVAGGRSISRIAAEAGADVASVTKWRNGKQKSLNLETVARLLDYLGAALAPPLPSLAREVCFVDARMVSAGAGQPPPQAEDYMAVPLVDEVGAGPGLIPQGDLLSWFLVYKHQDAVRYRNDLVAVQIGRHSTSMEPVLHPGDIVLVDRQDREIPHPGRMMLVMDPDGAGKIKRVAVEALNADHRIMYYSDNAAANPPEIYSLREDFLGDWNRAVVGRVVWAWSDISGK
jgi:hypothetical protein